MVILHIVRISEEANHSSIPLRSPFCRFYFTFITYTVIGYGVSSKFSWGMDNMSHIILVLLDFRGLRAKCELSLA